MGGSAEGRGGQLQLLFVHEGPLRTTKKVKGNCRKGNCRRSAATSFCPRRTRRATENTLTPFCPRRAAKDHEGPRRRSRATAGKATAEGQRQLLLPFCPRRTRRATENTLTPFCPRRATKKVKGNCRKGNCRRSTATSTSFLSTEGRGEHLYTFFVHGGHGGPRRRSRATAGKATAEGQRQLQLPFCPRRGAENTFTPFLSTEDTEGHGENLFVHEGPLRTTKGHEEGQGQLQERQLQKVNGIFNFLFVHGGPRRTP